MFGFLNVYKPKGLTSFDVIRVLRKVLGIKQIGHTGTLDPLAEGVLPICVGKSTKLIDYLNEDKGYVADIQFGFVSDTYDTEGSVQKVSDKKILKDELLEILKTFQGEIEQTPPIYSAIKIKGKKLYEYAREGKGETVEIPKRKVFISKIELLDFDEENQIAKVEVACSKGTYIRSIVHDLGVKSNLGAVMTKLIRTKSGRFELSSSVKLDEFSSKEAVEKNLINPLDILNYPKVELNEDECYKVITGQKLAAKDFNNGDILILTKDSKFISIAKVENSMIKVIKVFA